MRVNRQRTLPSQLRRRKIKLRRIKANHARENIMMQIKSLRKECRFLNTSQAVAAEKHGEA